MTKQILITYNCSDGRLYSPNIWIEQQIYSIEETNILYWLRQHGEDIYNSYTLSFNNYGRYEIKSAFIIEREINL